MAIGDDKYLERDPRHHVLAVKKMLVDILDHLRDEADAVQDPRAQALFDTTTEVLGGMVAVYADYEKYSPEPPHGS